MLLGMLLYFIFEVRICCCSHVIHDKLFVTLVNFCLNYCFHLKTKADCVRKVLCVCVCVYLCSVTMEEVHVYISGTVTS